MARCFNKEYISDMSACSLRSASIAPRSTRKRLKLVFCAKDPLDKIHFLLQVERLACEWAAEGAIGLFGHCRFTFLLLICDQTRA